MSIATDEAELPAKTALQIRNGAACEWVKEKILTEGIGTGHEATRKATQAERAFGTWGFTAGAEWEARRDPIEAEIKAAAKRIFIFLNGPWQGKHYELSHVEGAAIADAAWETADKQRYEACAEFALKAARKAVSK